MFYYGHTKEEWNKLTKEEQIVIIKDYEVIINSRHAQTHKDKINSRTQSIVDFGNSK